MSDVLEYWKGLLGPLPPGFYLEIIEPNSEMFPSYAAGYSYLDLRYNGPGFESLSVTGINRPKKGATSVFVACYNVGMHPLDEASAVRFIKRSVESALQQFNR